MTITEDKITTVLDAQDIRALRSADRIVFRQHDGQGTIEATKDGRDTRDGFDQTHHVFVDCRIDDYGREYDDTWERVTPQTAECFHMEHSAKFSPETVTLMRRLGAGDTVTLVWTRDNNSETIRKADLHVDMLKVEVWKKADRAKRETYLLEVAITPDNSARMIRRGR